MITIGYQGVEGSNSEEAAKKFAKKRQFKTYQLLPLVSSFNVLDNVMKDRIDFGVIAVRNNSGGIVKESKIVLDHLDLIKKDEVTLPITHHMFSKNIDIDISKIKILVSHPQAFKQCAKRLSKDYPHLILQEDEDTATAARKLSLGILKDHCAVLCRKNAGVMNQLHLLEAHLEDHKDNKTTFEVY